MLIPKYWAQHKQRFDSKAAISSTIKQATIKRYGWSEISQVEALAHAKERVAEAHSRWLAGADILRRERDAQYNNDNGIPIREEIISKHNFSTNKPTTQSIVTRNSYGAQVANVDNVAIIDIDAVDLFAQLYPEDYANFRMKWFWEEMLNSTVSKPDNSNYYLKLGHRNDPKPYSMKPQVIKFVIVSILIASVIPWLGLSWIWLIVFMVAMMAYLWRQASKQEKAVKQENNQKRLTMLESIDPYMIDLLNKRVANHTNEQFRLYKTPAGYRLIATHDTFLPNDNVVAEWFATFHADVNYARLCQSQQCFRARLTSKPWRMTEIIEQNKLEKSIPTKEFYLIDNDDNRIVEQRRKDLVARQQWVIDYDKFALNYRACRYIESFTGRDASKNDKAAIKGFVQWHDRACQADKDLPLA